MEKITRAIVANLEKHFAKFFLEKLLLDKIGRGRAIHHRVAPSPRLVEFATIRLLGEVEMDQHTDGERFVQGGAIGIVTPRAPIDAVIGGNQRVLTGQYEESSASLWVQSVANVIYGLCFGDDLLNGV